MAGQYDGSIRINTRIDNSGFKSGLKEQEVSAKAQAAKLAAQYRKQGMSASEAFKKAWSEVDRDSRTTAKKSATYWKQSANDSKKYVGDISDGFGMLMGSLGKLAAVVGTVFSFTALVQLGQQAIDLASDIQEVDNVVSKSFGNMRWEMDALADTAIEKLGMSRLTAYQTGSTFMSMGKAMLDSMTDAKDMALELTSLTGHMASFFNVSQDTASTALKSIYTGETETLKQFGVVMTEANLQQFAYEQGIRKTLSAMTQSEKVMLRYQYVMEQLSFIGDDFTDTQDSWANQTRILSEQWKELLSILGSGLITVLTPVVKGLNAIVAALIDVSDSVGTVMSTIFGRQAQQLDNAAASASGAADAMGEYGAAMDAAGKSASKLASFDDINLLSSSGGGSGSTSGSDSGVADSTEVMKEELSNLEKAAQRIKELFVEGFEEGFVSDKTFADIEENIEDIKQSLVNIFEDPKVQQAWHEWALNGVEAMGSMTGSATSIATSIGTGVTEGIKDALEDPGLQTFASDKISSIFSNHTRAQNNAKDLANSFAKMATAFEGEGFQNIIEFLTKLGAVTGLETIDWLTGLAADLSDLAASPFIENSDEWTELLENAFDLISNLLGPAEELLDIFMENSSAYEDSWLHGFLSGLSDDAAASNKKVLDNWNGLLEDLISKTEGFSLADIQEWLISEEDISNWWDSTITPWFEKEKWDELLFGAGESFGEWWTGVVEWWDEELPAWWEESVTPWLSKEKWLEELDNIGEATTEAWDDSFGKWGEDIRNWFEEDVEPWLSKEKWQELGESMKEGLYNGFKAVVASIVDLLNELITGAENGINGLIGGINSFIDGYNSAVPTELEISTLQKVDFGSIPYPALAKGAVFRGGNPYLAIVNDQPAGQTNIEAPEGVIKDMVMEGLAESGMQGKGSNRPIYLVLDGKTVGSGLLPYIEQENKRIGVNFRR